MAQVAHRGLALRGAREAGGGRCGELGVVAGDGVGGVREVDGSGRSMAPLQPPSLYVPSDSQCEPGINPAVAATSALEHDSRRQTIVYSLGPMSSVHG